MGEEDRAAPLSPSLPQSFHAHIAVAKNDSHTQTHPSITPSEEAEKPHERKKKKREAP
jgi:hypothetical protein